MIDSKQGEYDSLAHLRYAYIEAMHGNPPIEKYFNKDEWSEDTLHISELGKCARQQMYRLSGAQKQVKSVSTLANESLMFIQANWIHALTVGALDWAGIMVNYEASLPGLPEGWSGHYDVTYEDWETDTIVGWDGKTVRPNAFDYSVSWPKPEHVWQVQGYMRFLPWVSYWQIEYIDRGGANTPQVKAVHRDDAKIDDRMFALNVCRSAILDNPTLLPNMLEPEFSIYYRKVNNEPIRRVNSVFVGPSWQCEWCPYHHGMQDKKTKEWTTFESSPCKPNLVKTQVGKAEKGIFKCISADHEESLTLWLKDQVLEYQIEEEVVE